MIVDITGIELIPGNEGKDCPGNGEHKDKYGNFLQCCCDECSYMMCCYKPYSDLNNCKLCTDLECPRSENKKTDFFSF